MNKNKTLRCKTDRICAETTLWKLQSTGEGNQISK